MKEEEIRPRELFNRYLELAERDVEEFFGDRTGFVPAPCPACGDDRPRDAFSKLGFQYATCPSCRSLFMTPRPAPEVIASYYRDSRAVRFWAERFYPETAEARREKMFQPRARRAVEWARRLEVTESMADIGSGYGIFLEEVERLEVFERLLGVDPNPELAERCRSLGFEVIERPVEDLPASRHDSAAFATCFEVLEHVHSPIEFLRAAGQLLRPDGVLFLTTLTVSGWDIQELWKDSKSVHPPHHINLLSVAGMRALFDRAGFRVVDLSTPGELDVDIVENAVEEDPGIEISRFAQRILERGADTKEAFQGFLQKHRLSSHVQVVARAAGPEREPED